MLDRFAPYVEAARGWSPRSAAASLGIWIAATFIVTFGMLLVHASIDRGGYNRAMAAQAKVISALEKEHTAEIERERQRHLMLQSKAQAEYNKRHEQAIREIDIARADHAKALREQAENMSVLATELESIKSSKRVAWTDEMITAANRALRNRKAAEQ